MELRSGDPVFLLEDKSIIMFMYSSYRLEVFENEWLVELFNYYIKKVFQKVKAVLYISLFEFRFLWGVYPPAWESATLAVRRSSVRSRPSPPYK